MMTRFLFLFLSCATLFAQRTPFKVNGTIVNNPNLKNSGTITWTIVGADITGVAAGGGGGGDTIWTNNAGLIELIGSTDVILNPAVADGASAVAFSLNSSNALSTSGAKLLTLGNGGTEKSYISLFGGYAVGNGLADDWGPLSEGQVVIGDFFGIAEVKSVITTSDSTNYNSGSGLTLVTRTNGIAGINFDGFGVTGSGSWLIEGGSTNGLDYAKMEASAGGTVRLRFNPSAQDGTTPYTFDTPLAHTTGNIAEFKNNGTDVGTIAAVSGYTGTGERVLTDDGTYKSSLRLAPDSYEELITTNIAASSDTVVYTVPSTHRAIVNISATTTNTTGTTTWDLKLKPSGGSYYTFLKGLTLNTNSSTDLASGIFGGTVCEPGDIVAINPDKIGMIIQVFAELISTNSGLRTGRVLGLTTGTNRIYTCTTGKTAIPTCVTGLMANRITSLILNQSSGGTLSYDIYIDGQFRCFKAAVPSGGSGTSLTVVPSLTSGQTIDVVSSSSDATQIAYATFYEVITP